MLPASVDRPTTSFKAFYFAFYGAMASLLPFIVLYYEFHGLTGSQIGILTGLSPLITLVAAPLWGGVADATRQHKRLLLVSIGSAILAAGILSTTTSFAGLLLVLTAFAIVFAPILPLVDSALVELLQERKDAYGRQRFWGTVGWGLAAPLTGVLIERSGLHWLFWVYFVFMVGALLASWRLPVQDVAIGSQFWQGMRSLLVDVRWFLFLGIAFIAGMGLSVVTNYLFLYMNAMGASQSLMGLSLTVATLSEMPVFYFSDRLLNRWGARGLLAFSISVYVLRVLAYSVVYSPYLVLLLQLLHGPVFAAMWVAGVSYASQIAPRGLSATAQSLFSSAMMGMGGATGALVGGVLYENLGPWMMFRWVGFVVIFSLLVFLMLEKLVISRQTKAI
jgi:PPP family 3-phenylpropionic acid transporter